MASTSGTGSNWPIENFMKFENLIWTKMDMPNISLKICYDLLIVTSNNIILLSLNLKNKLKSYFKNKTMIFAYEENGILQKVKFKLNCSLDDVETIANIISIYTPIYDLNEARNESNAQISINNFQHLLNEEIVKEARSIDSDSIFPPGFPLNEFIKSCIIDPAFPTLVEKVEEAIKQLSS